MSMPDGSSATSMPQDVRVGPDGRHFYVADMIAGGVFEMDGDTFTPTQFIATGVGAHGITPSRDGKHLYVANRGSMLIDGPPHGPGSVSVIDTSTSTVTGRWAVPGGGSPDMGNLDATGTQLWLSGRFDSEVYEFDTTTGALVARIPVGHGPARSDGVAATGSVLPRPHRQHAMTAPTDAVLVEVTPERPRPRAERVIVRRFAATVAVLTAVVAAAPLRASRRPSAAPTAHGPRLVVRQLVAVGRVVVRRDRPARLQLPAGTHVRRRVLSRLSARRPAGRHACVRQRPRCRLGRRRPHADSPRCCCSTDGARAVSVPRAALLAVTALAFYPYAWFLYGTAYSDALFLVFVLGAFLALEADRTVIAGILGALATATRPTAVVVVIGLVAVALDRRGLIGGRRPRSRLRPADGAVLLSISGLALWCAWLAIRFGNPFAFIETEGSRGWNQAPGPHTWFKSAFLDHLHRLAGVRMATAGRASSDVSRVPCGSTCVSPDASDGATASTSSRPHSSPRSARRTSWESAATCYPAFPVFALVGAWLETAPHSLNGSSRS